MDDQLIQQFWQQELNAENISRTIFVDVNAEISHEVK